MKNQKLLSLILVSCFLLIVSPLFAQEPGMESPAVGEGLEELAPSENVSLNFKEADIGNVLKIISYKSGVNIVATPEVRGAVTIMLKDVPWERALETIVRTYGFAYEWISDKVIMVSTLERLAEQRRVQEEAAAKEPMDTVTIVLNFTKAEDIKASIEKLLSVKGKITVETRTNTLIITDTKSNLIKISKVVRSVDRVTPQVLIEAKIIETNLTKDENIGIKWQLGGQAKGAARPTTYPFPDSTSHSKFMPGGFSADGPDMEDFLKFGTLDASGTQATLELLFTDTDTEMLSNPRIVTLDNQPASIEVVTLDPTPQWTYNEDMDSYVMTDYRQEKYGILLNVTPQINKLGYVTLKIEPEVSDKTGDKTLSSGALSVKLPIIDKQTTSTTVMIADGNTLVIGGLIKNKVTDTVQKVPLLGDIPLLGLLFKHKAKDVVKKDLLIFITPTILTLQASGED